MMQRLWLILTLTALLSGLTAAHEYFPQYVGNWWTYDGVDLDTQGNPVPSSEYTNTSTVIGDTVINGLFYFVSEDSHFDEMHFGRSSGDTLMFFMDLPLFLTESSFWKEVDMAILPNPIGTQWTVLDFDTAYLSTGGSTVQASYNFVSEILSFGSHPVQTVTYENTYHLQMHAIMEYQSGGTTVVELDQDVWLAQYVGMVEIIQPATIAGDDTLSGYHEELTDYYINPAVAPEMILTTPASWIVYPPYPNPFNPTTHINYQLAAPGDVILTIYDVSGSLVQRLFAGRQTAGTHEVIFNAVGLPSGLYFTRVQVGDQDLIQKLVLLK